MTTQDPTPTANPFAKGIEDTIVHVPLESIHADWKWNSRSEANVTKDSHEPGQDGKGFSALVRGIFNDGQDEPVVLRKNPNTGKGERTYLLVSGFRRYKAISTLNDKDAGATYQKEAADAKRARLVPNTDNGTIRAVVKDLDEKGARLHNIRENTQRDDLEPQDAMFGIRELADKYGMQGIDIAYSIGRSQNYVAEFLRISKISKGILKHWREGGTIAGVSSNKHVTKKDMDKIVAKEATPEKQEEQYVRLLRAAEPPATEGEKEKQWMIGAKKRAHDVGKMLGALAGVGFLKITEEVPWEDVAMILVKVGSRELPRRAENAIGKAAFSGFEAAGEEAADEGEEEEEETETEETETKTRRRKSA